MAAGLSDADIRNVAAYFSKARCGVTGGDKAKAELGKAKVADGLCGLPQRRRTSRQRHHRNQCEFRHGLIWPGKMQIICQCAQIIQG